MLAPFSFPTVMYGIVVLLSVKCVYCECKTILRLFVHSFRSVLNQFCNDGGLRHINRVTTRNLDDCRTRALGHKMLRRWRNHLVLGHDQIPTRLGPPCRLTDRATECVDTPRNLRVSHEGGLFRIHVGRERGGKTSPCREIGSRLAVAVSAVRERRAG